MLTIEQLSKEIKPELADKEARLDIRLNTIYKMFLKQVYKQAGYRSLSAFILQAAIEKAEAIIEKEKLILASEKDKEKFFKALLKTAEPNEALTKASKAYKKAIN
jgi:uncharacterized protein (DUF1778 family)